MGGIQKVLKILHGTELRIHFFVIGDGIVGAQGSLSSFHADLIHGHEPENVHAQVLEAWQLGFYALERPFRGELADIHFIDDGAVRPVRVILYLGRAGQKARGGYDGKQCLFHMR